MASNVRNFKQTWRGRIVGLMGLSLGLASSVYTLIFRLAYYDASSTHDFILFMAITNVGAGAR
jgi:hypothetical protein